MPRVEIVRSLVKKITKTFSKSEAYIVLDLLESLEKNPHKGKYIGSVGGIEIKELKYKKFRFYFIFDGHTLRAMSEEDIVDLLFRFVKMSEKRNQQDIIEKIKQILRKIGPSGFH